MNIPWGWLHPLEMLWQNSYFLQLKFLDILQCIATSKSLSFQIKLLILNTELLDIFAASSYHDNELTSAFEIHTNTKPNLQSWTFGAKMSWSSIHDKKIIHQQYEDFLAWLHVSMYIGHHMLHQKISSDASNNYQQLKTSKIEFLLIPLTLPVLSISFHVETSTEHYLLYWWYTCIWFMLINMLHHSDPNAIIP